MTNAIAGKVNTQQLCAVLREASDIFSDKPGKTQLCEFTVALRDHTLIQIRAYMLLYAKRDAVKREVNSMFESGMIEWSSPIVVVKKKDGTHRLCRLPTTE